VIDPQDPPGVQLEKRAPGDVVPVLDGELVTHGPDRDGPQTVYGRIVRPRADAVVTYLGSSSTAAAAGRTGQHLARAGWTVGQGALSWCRRAQAAATHGVLREQVRLAHLSGDPEAIGKAADRLQRAKDARSKRLQDLPQMVRGAAVTTAWAACGLLGILVLGGVLAAAYADGPAGAAWARWWAGVAALIGAMHALVDLVLTVAPIVAVPVLVLLAWREGVRYATPPLWLRTAADADDLAIDETTIARALDALRIQQISAHLKSGAPLQYLTPCRVDGRGTHAVIRLPHGVTAERIARRRADFATGLHRLAKEVWPKTGTEEGILDVWIADKGALAEGAGPYPLLHSGTTDFFKGFPVGKTLRGTPVTAPMMGRNTIVGGMPEQGKSSAARCKAAGASLDPTVELRIWVPDSNFDFEHFRPRCSRYVMGAEPEKIEQILQDLRELHAEVQSRGQLLVEYEIAEVNRSIASKGVGLHPLFALLEEAHVAMQHPEHGAEISHLVTEIVRLGRKRGIHFVVSTQAPTANSIPRDVTRNCSNGIAFAVGDFVANDALLGQGAYAGGHRATELIPGTDRGTALVKGFSGQRSEIVQFYFIDVAEVPAIIDRGLDAIARAGRGVPGTGPSTAALMVERDLLEDLDAVLGTEALPIADVASLLSAHAPGWAPYRSLTGKALRQRLADRYGVKVPSTGNRWPLDPALVREALARRVTE
jgi:S-DNA-T family DNA segregation ATPase FtsK/SpoIIIE